MIGAQYPQPDPRGWLVFHDLPDTVQAAEDSTAAADFTRAGDPNYSSGVVGPWGTAPPPLPDGERAPTARTFTRYATPTERALLASLGHTLPPQLFTLVSFSSVIRNRRWPQLEN